MTLIKATETVPGLQICENGNWFTVPATPKREIEGEWFICNAGDFLALITKGRVISPLHRVVTTQFKRTSLVFFYYADYDVTLASFDDLSVAESDRALSIFTDQSQKGDFAVTFDKNLPFGQFIYKKWESVGRGY